VLVLYGIGMFFNALSILLVFVGNRRLELILLGVAVLAALALARGLGYLGSRPEEAANAPSSSTAGKKAA
jgi:hypothetical protein